MERFDPPGFLNDFDGDQAKAWSDWISKRIDASGAGEPNVYQFDAPRPRFFNPLALPSDVATVEKDISWTAFPRLVELDSATDEERWSTADSSRDAQDEYCEWSVARLADGRIKRVMFTSEGPEYWEFLAAVNLPLVVKLYQTHVSPAVVEADLVGTNGRYKARNKWNNSTKRGAMHLIQQNNTLGAEIELAAGASNVRKRNGAVLTGARELILCGGYGQAERHSDPTIGAEVNTLARANADISLANPVGLYLAGLSTAGWQTPDGADAGTFWKVTRGTDAKAVRAIYEVPEGKNYAVGDIEINGKKIRYGAQIADFITIKLTGLAARVGTSVHPPLTGCKALAPQPIAAADGPDVEAALAPATIATR